MSDVPRWIVDEVDSFIYLLDLEGWKFTVTVNSKPGGQDNAAGYCEADPQYLRAHIELLETLEPDTDRSTIIHETLHVFFAEMHHAVKEYIIGELVPDDHRALALKLWRYEQERMIQHLARALKRIKPAAENSNATHAQE